VTIRVWAFSQARFAALVVLVSLLVSAAARADSPYDARQQRLAESVLAKGKDPEAMLELLRMNREADEADPELVLSLFKRIQQAKNVGVEQRMFAARRVAWDLRRTGDTPAAVKAFDALGYLRKFRVIGPFDNEGKRGFESELGPEASRTQAVNLEATYPGRERQVKWRELPDIVHGGYVSFDAVFRPTENVCALAETTLVVPKARTLTLWVGGGGATKVYWNGQVALNDPAYRSPFPDRSAVVVPAQAGKNRVLIKTCVTSGTFGFYLRVGDEKGEPLQLEQSPGELAAVPAGSEKATIKPLKAAFDMLEDRAAGDNAKADAVENLARFLWYTGADDPAERRARQLAERAAELEPSVTRLMLAASQADERYARAKLVARAEALNPNDPEVLMARAKLTATGPGSHRALSELEKVPENTVAGMEAHELRVALYRELGLEESAKAEARKALEQAPKSTAAMARLADLLSGEERKDESLELERKILALRKDYVPARRVLLEDAIALKREGEAIEHLDALRALFPGDEKRMVYVAEAYDALGREDLKLATLRESLEVAPESPSLLVRIGRALLRAGQSDAAADSFKQALALRPQDAETRELLEQITPEKRLDESYAADQSTLLERRKSRHDQPVTVLNDLTVNTVFENGLGSRFVQYAAEANDEEGARRLRARSIQFDPDTQRVDIRLARVFRKDGRVLEATETYERELGEPWYRMYYDTRALVVVFPDLEPGDSVELRYRIDDVAPRNLFADYFGDLNMLQGSEPIEHVEYVLITPASRKFYFNEPKLKGLKHEEKVDGARRIHRFVADDVPALRFEQGMPGITEIVPYLHVSTYASWQDVGKWYWGLIRDQLYADEALKAVVRDLKKQAKDEKELVQKIYGWVVKNTRYVALEFGIHGYLPYRVPDVVRRGFGDCKDKASLIYTMLREAGIDARFVLLRTRRNGAISELPASLSVFDHAIAYVPKYDLYLDGTAEHSGTRELPEGDQGVMVLVVGPNSAELKKTPVLPPDASVRTRKLSIELAPDGKGTVRAEERVAGVDAAGYRNTFQAEGTRKERLERKLASSYPGLKLEKSTFTGLDDIESDVQLSYELSAPEVGRREGSDIRTAPTSLGDLLREVAPSPSRVYPLEIGSKSIYREERTVRVPKGYRVTLVPAGGKVESRFGKLAVHSEQRGGEVVSSSELVMAVDRVEPKEYPEFRRFIEQADELLRQRIAFAPEKR
jgi:Flp pilus assembly protein TadD/transglutaminase-like putative cysteine protease